MNESASKIVNLTSGIKRLKVLLIGLTVVELIYLIISFTDVKLLMKLNNEFRLEWVLFTIHYLITIFFIWFLWKRIPSNNKKKVNNTLMILFLGLIGMWLWMPNKKEIK